MEYVFVRADVQFECELEYVPVEIGSTENGLKIEPDYDEYMQLMSATHKGIEMIGFLADYVVKDIQDEALEVYRGR